MHSQLQYLTVALPKFTSSDQKLPKVVLQVGEMWQKANDDEKAPYIAMSNQDKQRYQAELEAYNYRYYRQ